LVKRREEEYRETIIKKNKAGATITPTKTLYRIMLDIQQEAYSNTPYSRTYLTGGRGKFSRSTAKKFDKRPAERGLASNGVVNLGLKKSKLAINRPSEHTRAIRFIKHRNTH
jgi:hypothetical protein